MPGEEQYNQCLRAIIKGDISTAESLSVDLPKPFARYIASEIAVYRLVEHFIVCGDLKEALRQAREFLLTQHVRTAVCTRVYVLLKNSKNGHSAPAKRSA